ncbi:MAG: ribosome maturation factor RimP [Actinomycetales bacterium]|nr:ribosome maturation factor RimP [Actinomycetales bacterium]
MSSPSAQLAAVLSGPLSGMGLDVEDVTVQKAGRRHVVRVVVDQDGGVDLDTIAAASQQVSAILDDDAHASLLPGPFVLEVTSPGVDRPLTEPRHWRRALTRLVKVTTREGAAIEGRVSAVPTDAEIVLETSDGQLTLLRSDIATAVVQVEFNRKDEPAAEESDADPVAQDEGE